jgi:DNA-binding CsgD family transcriptional regulator
VLDSVAGPADAEDARTWRPDVTRREAEVLDLVAARFGNAEIAVRLHISKRTVESHMAALLRKFAVADRAALIRVVTAARPAGTDSGKPDGGAPARETHGQFAQPRVAVAQARFTAARARATAAKGRELASHIRAAKLHRAASELYARLGYAEIARREQEWADIEVRLIEVAFNEAREAAPST